MNRTLRENAGALPHSPTTAKLCNLAVVFTVEVGLAFGALTIAMILSMGIESCASAGCKELYWNAWLLMVAHVALLVVCAAAFAWAKRDVVKPLAVLVLPIGTVTAWMVYIVMASIALDA